MTAVWIASVLYALSASISVAAALAVRSRREARGAVPLANMLAAAAVWAACDAVEVHLSTVAGRRVVSQIQYVGVVSAAPFFFEAALALGRRDHWLALPWVRAAVWAVPLVSLVMAWTSAWHPWLWTAIRLPGPGEFFAAYEYGWWFWVLTAQHYALMGLGAWLLVDASRRVSRAYRTPMLGVVVAVAVAWVGNAVYVFKLGPLPGLNWLTLSLGLSGALLAWLVVNEGLLDLVPRAREALFDSMTDAVAILDGRDTVIFANQPARAVWQIPTAGGRLPATVRLPETHESFGPWAGETALDHPTLGRRWLDVRVDPIVDRWGDRAGRLIVARDISMRKALEAEREELIAQLRGAQGTVAALERLLPVCASCHKIRDESGKWSRIDRYLREHSVQVSHGICPDCYERMVGDAPMPPGASR